MKRNNPQLSLDIINKCFNKDLSQEQINILESYKIRPLIEIELFDKAFSLSNRILARKDLSLDLKIDVLLNRALLYEIQSDFNKSKKTLDTLSKLFETRKTEKDEDYAEYLYRTASFYRMNKKSDSAKIYAQKAIEFSETNHYPTATSVAYLINAFLYYAHDFDRAKYNYDQALFIKKQDADSTSIAVIYGNLAILYLHHNKPLVALKYTDSILVLRKGINDNLTRYFLYDTRALIFEKLNMIDSAYVNHKKYLKHYLGNEYTKSQTTFNELNFQYELNLEAIAKNKVEEDNIKINTANNWLKIFITSLLLVTVLLFLLYRKLVKKNKEIKNKTEEKEVLLKELHHRVKNNLMLILSLIDFQKDDFLDDFHKTKLTDLQHRIEAIAFVHQQMMGQSNDDIDDSHDIEDYIKKIAESLFKLYPEPVHFKSKIVKIAVQLDIAVPLGILINELISNSLKHAKTDEELQITLEIFEEDNSLKINYKDGGLAQKVNAKKESLGLFIIKNMIKQLHGQYEENNFSYHITLTRYN